MLIQILASICYLFLIGGIIFSFGLRGIRRFSKKVVLLAFPVLALLISFGIINGFPAIIGLFNTSEPFLSQLFIKLGSLALSILFTASLISLILGLVSVWKTKTLLNKNIISIVTAFGIGITVMGAMSLISYFFKPSLQPLWPKYSYVSSYMPSIAILLEYLNSYIFYTALTLLSYTAIDRFTHSWEKRKIITAILFIVGTIAVTGLKGIESIPFWIVSAIILGIILLLSYVLVVRFDHSVIPIIVAGYTITNAIQQATFGAFPNILLPSLATSIIIFMLAIAWFKKLNR